MQVLPKKRAQASAKCLAPQPNTPHIVSNSKPVLGYQQRFAGLRHVSLVLPEALDRLLRDMA